MKIAILCASGKAGKAITNEVLERGFNPVCFVRDSSKMNEFANKIQVVQKDIFALDSKDLADFDVIIDAFGEWQDLSLHKKTYRIFKQDFTRKSCEIACCRWCRKFIYG